MIERKKPRGGDHGGGTTVQRVTLSPKAAAHVKARATILGTRYTKDAANASASALLEAFADRQIIVITPAMRAALPALEAARQQATGDVEQGLAQLIAAIWTSAT